MQWWMMPQDVNDRTMSVDNDFVMGMNFSVLPMNVKLIQWREGRGEIELTDGPNLRSNFYDITPYAPFFQQFMSLLTGISLTQAKKIQTDLITELYENKRQLPYAHAIAAGSFSWDATDAGVTAMSSATLPALLGGTSGSGSSLLAQINAQSAALAGDINGKIVNPGNNLTAQINARVVDQGNAIVGEVNSRIVTPGNNLLPQINNRVVTPGNALLPQINSRIAAPGNALLLEVNARVVGNSNNLVSELNTIISAINAIFNQVNGRVVYPGEQLRLHLNNTVLGTRSVAADTVNSVLAVTPNRALTNDIPPDSTNFANIDAGPGGSTTTFPSVDTGMFSGVDTGQFSNVDTAQFLNVDPAFIHVTDPAFSNVSSPPIAPGSGPGAATIQFTPLGQGTPVTVTVTEMSDIMSGIQSRRTGLLTTQFNKTAAVNAMTGITDVIAYDVTAGW